MHLYYGLVKIFDETAIFFGYEFFSRIYLTYMLAAYGELGFWESNRVLYELDANRYLHTL